MSKQRQIQKNQKRHIQNKKKTIQTPLSKSTPQKQEPIDLKQDPKLNKNNWILFGFIGIMCLIWGILYWIFIV